MSLNSLAYVFTGGSLQTACLTRPIIIYTQYGKIKYMPLRLREIFDVSS